MSLFRQLTIVFGLSYTGFLISKMLPVNFPESVISLFLLLFLMIFNVIKPESIKTVADFFINNMAFFFIPSGVSIIDKYPVLKGRILVLLFICLITTVLVFIATSYTVTLAIRLTEGRKGQSHD